MPELVTYLTFDGNCEAAFTFYKSVFGGEFAMISRFGEMPPDPKMPVSDADKQRVMHVSYPIGEGAALMGSDTISNGPKVTQGNNFSISINAHSKAEADKLFNGLSAGGKVTMPLADTFWGAYFGMFSDRFGINWMVNFDAEPKGK
ncbi:MAG: VOC family protein [Flavobacteriales bacterium]|jgi:PhnB protein|nr:VOC family protein [Flavobacteriales bacterium]MBK6893181.1 VOC family protein [Flavobacteriales bacterium]MBK7249087.1 VOC family protein [Flavobacteriales bacterium]MBK7285663.1 VOC family protein [Flavobacteriales bacterium]MBK9058663.1 VOC family protein [Flavobacteriales bacterium]